MAKVDETIMQNTGMAMAWIALVFSLLANFFCTFTVQEVTATITTAQNSFNGTVGPYYAGLWNYKSYETFWTQSDNTIYIQTFATCSKYPEGTMVDPKWKTAQAFTIIATVLGGLAAIAMTTATCQAPTGYWKSYAGLLLLVCASQGLTLLFLRSNACAAHNMTLNTDAEDLFDTQGTVAKCKLSSGGILSACAVAVWFFAALFSALGTPGKKEADMAEGDEEVAKAAAEEAEKPKEEAEAVAEQAPEVSTA
jgi:hypothetical protein